MKFKSIPRAQGDQIAFNLAVKENIETLFGLRGEKTGAVSEVSPASMSAGAPRWDEHGNLLLSGARGLLSKDSIAQTLDTIGGQILFQSNNGGVWLLGNCYYDGTNFRYKNDGPATFIGSNGTLGAPSMLVAASGTAGAVISWMYLMYGDVNGVLNLGQGKLKFPVSQLASADPNVLDDYEEGTFTAYFYSNSVLGATSTENTYTKIGNQVTVRIHFNNITPAATGGIQIAGLPYPIEPTEAWTGGLGSPMMNLIVGATTAMSVNAYGTAGSSSIFPYYCTSNGSWAQCSATNGQTGTYYWHTFTYRTST